MHRVLLTIALACLLTGIASAQAAHRHKHRALTSRPAAAVSAAPVQRAPQVGPIWSGPNQCWTDEGYGRYAPCDSGRGGGM